MSYTDEYGVEHLDDGMVKLPCGCLTNLPNIEPNEAAIYEPCSMDCTYYRYTIDSANEEGTPVVYVEVDDE